jgi:hypothetical protein
MPVTRLAVRPMRRRSRARDTAGIPFSANRNGPASNLKV